MCKCDEVPAQQAVIRGVPFQIGRNSSGLWWGIGSAPMASGGRVTIIGEDPTDKTLLYAKLVAIVKDIEALAAHLPAVGASFADLKRAMLNAGGAVISGPGPFLPRDMPTQIMGPGPFLPRDMPVQIMGPAYHVGDIIDDLGDAAGAVGHAITHPGDIAGALGSFLAHPGEIAKPLAYGAMLAMGPAGVAYAYAADQAGVLDGLAKAIDQVGGIYIGIVKSVALGLGCTWVLNQLGLSELGFACAIFSMTVDFVKAVVNKDRHALIDILKRLILLARSYGLDPLDAVKTLLQVAFQTVGNEIAMILGSLEDIRASLLELAVLSAQDINYMIGVIQDQESQLKIAIPGLPDVAKGSIGQVNAVVSTAKISGADAIANGLRGGPANPSAPPPVFVFAPRLRKYATAIDYVAATRSRQNSPAQRQAVRVGGWGWADDAIIVANIDNGILDSQSDNETKDLANMISIQALQDVSDVFKNLKNKDIDAHSYDVFRAAVRARLQPFPPGVFEHGR